MKHKIYLFFCSLVLVLSSGSFEQALACLCASGEELCSSYNSADVVFIGKVIEIKKATRKINLPDNQTINVIADEYKFVASRIFSGTTNNSELILVSEGTNCDFYFEQGKDYLVFAYRNESGKLGASICTPTKLVEEAKKELFFLQNTISKTKSGIIRGSIFNSSLEKSLPKISIDIQDILFPNKTFKFQTNSEGIFESELPAGKYKVKPHFPEAVEIDKDLVRK